MELIKLHKMIELITDSFKPDENSNEKYIGLEHISQGTLRLIEYGSSEDVQSQKYKFKKGDILVGKLRPYFRKVIIAPFDGVCSTDIWVLRPKKPFTVEQLFPIVASDKFIKYIVNSSTGTRMPRAKWEVAKQFSVKKEMIKNPSVKAINQVNAKIEINDKLIEQLQEYSELLFRKWFVAFNFPDKNGKPYKDNGGAMQELDEKKIPLGWSKEPLANFVINISNGDWGEEFPFEDAVETYCIRGADIPKVKHGRFQGTPLRFIKSSKDNTKLLKHGNIVIEASGGSPTQSTGRTVLIRDSLLNTIEKPVYFSNFSKVVVPKDNYSMFFYLLLNNLYKRDVFFHFEGKTSGIRNLLLNSMVQKLEFINPSIDVLKNFEAQTGLIWDKIFSLGCQNELLEEYRDLLIRKLIK